MDTLCFDDAVVSHNGAPSLRPCQYRHLPGSLTRTIQRAVLGYDMKVYIFHIVTARGQTEPRPGEEWRFAYLRHNEGGVDRNGRALVHVYVSPQERLETTSEPYLDSDTDEVVEEVRSGEVVLRRIVRKIARFVMMVRIENTITTVQFIVPAEGFVKPAFGHLPDTIIFAQRLDFGVYVDTWLKDKRASLGNSIDVHRLLPPTLPSEIHCSY